MIHKKSEKGQALVIIALAAVGLFAFTALSIDGGMVFSDRRHAQNAADTAVLAAALARVRTGEVIPLPSQATIDAATVAAGIARATSNGYTNDADSTVDVYICNEAGITCEGLPATVDTPEEKAEYIQVKIKSIVHTTFARIVGRQTITNVVTAIARAKIGVPGPLFDGSALVALKQDGSKTIDTGANVKLDITNSGVFDNSTSGCAFNASGNGTINTDTGYTIAAGGTSCTNGNSLSGNVTDSSMYQSGTQVAYPPTFNIPTPSITCSAPGTRDDTNKIVHPGSFGSENFNNGSYTFMPGNYCFNGSLTIGGNAKITANDVNIVFTSGDLSVTSTLNCNNLLVYINGGSGITFNGTSHLNCTNTTFFAETGSVNLLGNGAYTLTAPGSGPYAHLLIYMPYGNGSDLKITGNSGNLVSGSIIGVSAPVTISGNSGSTAMHSSITGYTITLLGNSTTNIDYVPEEQFTVLDPSAIELTK